MSWHFSQALVAASLGEKSLDGEPSAPSSGSPIPLLFCAPDRMKAFSRLSRFGMTCEPLTDDLGAGVLTWCLAGSLAKTSAQPAKAQESTESAAECGRTWHESFARWDRASLSWRTPQCSLLAGLDEFSETWPRWGMMRNGECSALSMPVHLTSETESGLWPTPRAGNPGSRPNGKGGKILAEEVAITAGQRMRGQKTWSTPTCHNANECDAPSEATRNTPTLTHQARGGDKTQPKHLNPMWVEWLMGWPPGWTDLKQSETDKFRAWQHSHGGY
jgi:hypothetical protein